MYKIKQANKQTIDSSISMNVATIRHFSVTPYITICPSTETYFGVYLRGAMSAVTGIYRFCLLLNIIFFVLRSFCTLTNSEYHDEIPHDGISPVYKCKKHVPKKIYFTIEMQPNIFLKLLLGPYMYAFTGCNLRVGKFDVSASNMIIFLRQYFTKLGLMDSGNA